MLGMEIKRQTVFSQDLLVIIKFNLDCRLKKLLNTSSNRRAVLSLRVSANSKEPLLNHT